MAADPPVLYNDWWVYLRDMTGGTYGSSHLNPSDYQIHNAYKMRALLQAQGYDNKAIAGVIGNAQVESGISPGSIEKWSILPNGAETLSDVSNSYMLQYYTKPQGVPGYGLGLLQWDRFSSAYQSHDLLGWCNANGYQWYDGDGQLARLAFEFQNNATYHYWRLNYGNTVTWQYYKDIETNEPTWDAGEAANVWASCWELSSLNPEGRQYRRDNANFWYDYFEAHPTPPGSFFIPLLWMFKRRKELKTPCRRI